MCASLVQAEDIVVVDTTSSYAVDGVAKLPFANGLVVNGSSGRQCIQETALLAPDSTRIYLWVGAYTDVFFTKEETKTLTDEQKREKFAHLDFEKLVPACFDARPESDQFKQLGLLQEWKATKNVVVHLTQPHPRDEADFDAYSRYFRACIREIKKRYPDLGPLYFNFYNEPDYEYPRKWENRNLEESVALYFGCFKKVDADIKKEFPDVTLIGPGISQFMGWASWKSWTLPFLKRFPEANYFNCQPYASRFTDLLAWTETLQSASLALNGKRVPMILTETNVNLDKPADDWWKHKYHVERVRREAEALMGVLARPDLFAIKEYFLYFWQANHSEMWFKHDGITEAAPVYWLHWIFRDVKGTRLLASANNEASPVKVFAANEGQVVTTVLFNDSPIKQSLELKPIWPKTMDSDPEAKVEYLRYDEKSEAFVHGEMSASRSGVYHFAPWEIVKVRWEAPASVQLSARQVSEEVFRAKETALDVAGNPVTLAITARKARGAESVRLRLACYVNDELSTERIDFSINGHAMSAPFLKEEKCKSIAYVDAAIPSDWVEENNQLVFEPVASATYRIMFASIAFAPLPENLHLKRSDQFVKKLAPLSLTCVLPPSVTGQTLQASLKLINTTGKAIPATVSFHLPEGWKQVSPLAALSVPSHGKWEGNVNFELPAGTMRETLFLEATAEAPGVPPVKARGGTVVMPGFQAEMAEKPPVIDGKLDEWNPASFLTVDHSGPGVEPYRSSVAAKWSEDRLYFAITVEGRKLKPVPDKYPYWWEDDAAEIFLDFFNAKKQSREHRTMQTVLLLKNMGANSNPTWFNVPSDPNGVPLKEVIPQTYEVAVAENENGYTAEISMDWNSLAASDFLPPNEQFVPKGGSILGCEMALMGRSILGAKVKEYNNPSKWGCLELLKAGVKVEHAKKAQPAIKFDSTIKMSAENPATGKELARFDAKNTTDWGFNKSHMDEVNGVLHLPNDHSMITYSKEIPGLATSNPSIEVTIAGFQKTGADPSGKLRMEARVFLTPARLEGFIEPYAMQDVMLLLLNYSEGSDLGLMLCAKNKSHQGFGETLWQGVISHPTFPVTIGFVLNQNTYKVLSSANLETSSGSISGKLNSLNPEKWKNPLHFGIISLLGNVPGGINIRDITLRDVPTQTPHNN